MNGKLTNYIVNVGRVPTDVVIRIAVIIVITTVTIKQFNEIKDNSRYQNSMKNWIKLDTAVDAHAPPPF